DRLGTRSGACPERKALFPVKSGSLHKSGARSEETRMNELINLLWHNEEGQDIAEYAVMLAVILVIVIGTVRLIGSNANNVFSQVASRVEKICFGTDIGFWGRKPLRRLRRIQRVGGGEGVASDKRKEGKE